MKITNYIRKSLEVILTISIVGLVIFFYLNRKDSEIKEIKLTLLEKESPIVSKERIYKNLKIDSLLEIRDRKVILSELNKLILQQQVISKFKIYFSIKGNLNIDIKLVKPIARIITDKGSYYVDGKGSMINQKLSYSPRVLLVRGEGAEKTKNWLKVVHYITLKKELKKTISEVFVSKQNDISMRTRLAKFRVIFGNQEEIDQKFKKLKIIISKLSKDNMLDKYQSINLIYPGQVVCKV